MQHSAAVQVSEQVFLLGLGLSCGQVVGNGRYESVDCFTGMEWWSMESWLPFFAKFFNLVLFVLLLTDTQLLIDPVSHSIHSSATVH